METIQVTRDQLNAALEVANDETKKVLKKLFRERDKPSIDDYRTIKTYEDACCVLDEPIHVDLEDDEPDVVAYIKLKTISRALWGRNFIPKPDPEGNKIYYYPWFALYTKKEVEDMDDDDRGALLAGSATSGALAGFGPLYTTYRSSFAHATYGFRLCQETDEKATYFGKQFIELWADYLLFNI